MSGEEVPLYPEPRWHQVMYPSYYTESYLGENTPEVMRALGLDFDEDEDDNLDDLFQPRLSIGGERFEDGEYMTEDEARAKGYKIVGREFPVPVEDQELDVEEEA